MREEESDGDWIPMPKKAAPPKPASKPLAMADSDDLDVLLPPFVPRIRRRSPLPDIWTDPFQLPSSDPPTSQPSASDADSSASSQPVLKGKRTRLPTRPPSPIEVIDLSSSPLAAPASFSHQNTPIKNWGQSSHSTNPVLLSSAPTTPRCSPSPSKKLKTPETVLHNPAPQFEEGNSSLLYDQDALGIGYDENFGYFEQELEHPVQPWLSEFRGHSNTQNVESPISATSSSSSRFRRRSPPPQPRGGTGHINRILDFSSPPPVPPHIHPVASQSQTAAENERPNKEALQASALSLRRPNLTCITTLPEQRSLPPTPGTPHTGGGSGVLGSPVKNFNWITATRGNFSPRKQLKRVLEGVFLPSTVNEERKSSRKNETKKKSSESESESDTDENYLAQKSSYRSSCSSGRSTDSTSEESSEDEYPERDKSSDEAEEADRANSTPPSPLFTMPLPDNLEQALSTSEPSSPSFTSPPEKEVGVPKERPQPQRAISHPPPLQTPVKFRSMIPIPSSRCSSANSPAIVRSSTIPLPQNMPQKPPLYRNRTAPAAPKLAKPKQPPPAPERKNKVMLRQSSFGAWKDIPSGETPHKKTTTIWENVEVLDLTEAD
ncbi:hypothetical protein DFH27DRAFT_562866 [Peziza echinospora]|nr:hypothetical protein DFH27DRAFT_562866 [Peziza echinospora]